MGRPFAESRAALVRGIPKQVCTAFPTDAVQSCPIEERDAQHPIRGVGNTSLLRPRNTKDRPVGGLHVPADRGRSFVWQQRSSLTTRPLVKPKTQVFDNGGAMSHACCPFAAGFPARRGSRVRIPARRGN